MKRSKQPSCSQNHTRDNIALCQSIVFIPQNCIDHQIDCHSILTDAQTLIQSYLNTSLNQVSKKLSQSVGLCQKTNTVTQMSKFIELQTGNQKQRRQERISSSKKMIQNDLIQLESIYKKTEDLALRQREQRRQLKKLKKMYIEKVQELIKQQQQHKQDKNSLIHQIQQLKKYQASLISQKTQIQARMKQLETEVQNTKSQINHFEQEKLELLRRLEILQINYQLQIQNDNNQKQLAEKTGMTDRVHNIIHQNSELQSINDELNTINQMITNTDNQALSSQHKYKKMLTLMSLKNQYLQQRELIKVQEDEKKYRKAIRQLNQAVISRENIIFDKNKIIEQLTHKTTSYQAAVQRDSHNQSQKDKLISETAESWFTKTEETSLATSIKLIKNEYHEADETYNLQIGSNSDKFKQKISALVKANRIVGFEQSYFAIQSLLYDLIDFFQPEQPQQTSLLQITAKNLQIINEQCRLKALHNVAKIQKLMKYVQSSNQSYEYKPNQLDQQIQYQSQIASLSKNPQFTFRNKQDKKLP